METKLNIALLDKKLAKRGWNRSDFARESGISRQLLSYYIANPSLKGIEFMAIKLGLRVKDLLL